MISISVFAIAVFSIIAVVAEILTLTYSFAIEKVLAALVGVVMSAFRIALSTQVTRLNSIVRGLRNSYGGVWNRTWARHGVSRSKRPVQVSPLTAVALGVSVIKSLWMSGE